MGLEYAAIASEMVDFSIVRACNNVYQLQSNEGGGRSRVLHHLACQRVDTSI